MQSLFLHSNNLSTARLHKRVMLRYPKLLSDSFERIHPGPYAQVPYAELQMAVQI